MNSFCFNCIVLTNLVTLCMQKIALQKPTHPLLEMFPIFESHASEELRSLTEIYYGGFRIKGFF